jgi:hypothetical protein
MPQVAGNLFIPTPSVAHDLFGWCVITHYTRGRASSVGVSGKRSITSAPCAGMSWSPLRTPAESTRTMSMQP